MTTEVEVITYRLVNGETITGILDKIEDYHSVHTATEFVIPVVFHMDDKGVPAYVTTDEAAYPTIQVFMAHVMGKASHGTFEIRQDDDSEDSLVAVPDTETTGEITAISSKAIILP